MSGRGYYGIPQRVQRPAPPRNRPSHNPPTRSGVSGWIKIALGVGVGAGVWFLWPRVKPLQLEAGGDASKAPSSSPQGVSEGQPVPPLGGAVAEDSPPPQLTQEALGRGFPSQQAYEDAVVSNARQLRETGATVILAPHLQHLTPRLGPGA